MLLVVWTYVVIAWDEGAMIVVPVLRLPDSAMIDAVLTHLGCCIVTTAGENEHSGVKLSCGLETRRAGGFIVPPVEAIVCGGVPVKYHLAG